MKYRAVLAAGAAVFACGPENYTGGVRSADLEVWRFESADEIDRHPLFGTLPKQVRPLSDGSEIWTFSNCVNGTTPVQCRTDYESSTSTATQTTCAGGQVATSCCHNQFFVRRHKVEQYRPVGNCTTDCSTRPGGVCR